MLRTGKLCRGARCVRIFATCRLRQRWWQRRCRRRWRWQRCRLTVTVEHPWACTANDVRARLLIKEEDLPIAVIRIPEVEIVRVAAWRSGEGIFHGGENGDEAVQLDLAAKLRATGQRERLALGRRVRRGAPLLVAKLGPEVGAVA